MTDVAVVVKVMVIVSIPLVAASHRLHIAHWATLPLTTSTGNSAANIDVENKIAPMIGGQPQYEFSHTGAFFLQFLLLIDNVHRFCPGNEPTYCILLIT